MGFVSPIKQQTIKLNTGGTNNGCATCGGNGGEFFSRKYKRNVNGDKLYDSSFFPEVDYDKILSTKRSVWTTRDDEKMTCLMTRLSRRRLGNSALIERFKRESVRCQQS